MYLVLVKVWQQSAKVQRGTDLVLPRAQICGNGGVSYTCAANALTSTPLPPCLRRPKRLASCVFSGQSKEMRAGTECVQSSSFPRLKEGNKIERPALYVASLFVRTTELAAFARTLAKYHSLPPPPVT